PGAGHRGGLRAACPLYRARACEGRAASRHHQASSRCISRPAGGAFLPPPSRDRSGEVRRKCMRVARCACFPFIRNACTKRRMTLLGIPASELAVLAGAILVAGALTGIFAGLLGIGGAAISVPVMYEVFRAL